MNEANSLQVTRITLQVLSIGLLIAGAFWILHIFVPSILWATILVVTTWPVFQIVQRRLWNRRVLAILVMIGALLAVVIIPCALAIGTILSNVETITGWAHSLGKMDVPPPPGFLEKVPVFGPQLVAGWSKAEAMTAADLAPYTGVLAGWFLSKAGSVGGVLVQFVFTLIIAVVLYANGETAAASVQAFGRRLAGARGEEIVTLAAKAIRGVALGVIVTALAQAALSGIGLAVVGIPSAVFLTAVIFVLCLCQIGPMPILIPAIIWLYWRGGMVSGTVLLVFALVVMPLDNFLRPVLIRKGADIPLVFVFLGVIGGLVAMGVIGLFIGPVILAVVHTLFKSWVKEGVTASSPEKKESLPSP